MEVKCPKCGGVMMLHPSFVYECGCGYLYKPDIEISRKEIYHEEDSEEGCGEEDREEVDRS